MSVPDDIVARVPQSLTDLSGLCGAFLAAGELSFNERVASSAKAVAPRQWG